MICIVLFDLYTDYINMSKLKNYVVQIAEDGAVRGILNLLPDPMVDTKSLERSDILSHLAYVFFENTEIPLDLPIFTFLAYVSAGCIRNDLKFQIPKTTKPTHLNTWVSVLAPTGSAKTLSRTAIAAMIPNHPTHEGKFIEANFTSSSTSPKFINACANLPYVNSDEYQYGLWIEEEAAQFQKLVNKGSSTNGAEIKGFMLKMHNYEPLHRKTMKAETITAPIVMTMLHINTFDSYVSALGRESVNDGSLRRMSLVNTPRDGRSFTDNPLFNFEQLTDESLAKKIADLFLTLPEETVFAFSEDCENVYSECFRKLWASGYGSKLSGKENFYRTLLMEAWKYAVFHHLIMMEEGDVVNATSLRWGIEVSLIFLDSLISFINRKDNEKEFSKYDQDLERLKGYLREKPKANIASIVNQFNYKIAHLNVLIDLLRKESQPIDHQVLKLAKV